MYFVFIVIAFAVIPLLVGAIPVSQKSTRTPGPISISLSKRLNYLDHQGRVDLQRIQAGERHTMARLDRALSTYERNTGKAHPLALKRGHSNERRQSYENTYVPLTSHSNVQWTGEIAVGGSTDGQSISSTMMFNVEFSTAMADTWLGGPTCSTCTCNGHKVYDVSHSPTAKSLSSNAKVKFGENMVEGNVVSDTVFIGVAGNGSVLQAVNQTILVATNVDPAFQCQTYDAEGMIGLGFKETSELGANSVFDTIYPGLFVNGPDDFSFSYSDSGPELVFGVEDFGRFVPPVVFSNLTTNGLWQVQLSSISINGKATNVYQDIIIDTGSLFVSGDSKTISEIYSNIPNSAPIANSNQWTIPCETDVNMTVTFGSGTFTITGGSYILGPAPNTDPKADLCMGVFATVPDETTWIMGNSFMRDIYMVFDRHYGEIGMAPTSDKIFVQ